MHEPVRFKLEATFFFPFFPSVYSKKTCRPIAARLKHAGPAPSAAASHVVRVLHCLIWDYCSLLGTMATPARYPHK